MNTTEQQQITSALNRIVERTPQLGPTPGGVSGRPPAHRSSWRPLIAVAAATVIVVGIGIVAMNPEGPAGKTITPGTQTDQTEASQFVPDLDTTNVALLAPAALPDGYILYSDTNRVDANPIEGNADHIFGPPDASPDQIVEVAAGTEVEGEPCGSEISPITISGEPQFCTGGPTTTKRLRWNIGDAAVMICGGTSVTDQTLLELAAAVSIQPTDFASRQPGAADMDQQAASGAWLNDDQLIIDPLPDPTWIRLGHLNPTTLTSDSYLVGSATDWYAPTFLVDVYTNTEGTDIWSVMDKRHGSIEIGLRGTIGYLNDTDDKNPFLVWQERPGIIIRIQNNGGTAEAITAFAESLIPLNAEGRDAFLATGQTPPTPPSMSSDGIASTTTSGSGD